MATNDYRSYIRAMEEYRHSDTLQHAGKKGMKWGISHTPGYKAVGEKAKGILNAAGQYIYETAKKVGNAATTTYNKVIKTFNSAVKKPTVQTYNNSTKTFENNVQTWDSVDKKLANKASDARNEAFNERSERLKQDQVKKIADEYKNKFTKLYNPLDKSAPKLEATPNPEPRTIKEPEKPSEPEQVVEEPTDELDERTKEALKKVGISEEDWKNMSQQERDQATSNISFQRALDEIDEDNGNSEDEPGVKKPSDRMTDDDGNLKLIDKYGPYFYVNGENHYDIEGKEYLYSDGLYFPVDGNGEWLALKWNEEKFCFEPAEDFRHDDTSPRYIGEILDAEDDISHWGILGMKWGVRRYQNKDGSLTPEGKERYYKGGSRLTEEGRKAIGKEFNKAIKRYNGELHSAFMDKDRKRASLNTIKFESERKEYVSNNPLVKEINEEAIDAYRTDLNDKNADVVAYGQAFIDSYTEDSKKMGGTYYPALAGMVHTLSRRSDKTTVGDLALSAKSYAIGEEDGVDGIEHNSKALYAELNGYDKDKLSEADAAFSDARSTYFKTKLNAGKEAGISENARWLLSSRPEELENSYNILDAGKGKFDKKEIDRALNVAKQLDYLIGKRESVEFFVDAVRSLGLDDTNVNDMTSSDWKNVREYISDHQSYVMYSDSDQNELYHEGRGHLDGGHSGRYPWGSGEDPYQSDPVAKAGYNEAKNFINKYGVIGVDTVYSNNNPSPYANATDRRNARIGLIGDTAMTVGRLQQEPDKVREISDAYAKAIKDSGTRGWSVKDFEGIPTEQILESNKRQNAIEQWKKLNGENTPVEAGKAKAAKIVKAIGSAVFAVKLLEKATEDK